MLKNKMVLLTVLIALPLMGVGCKTTVEDAGIMRSLDGARTFEAKNTIATGGTLGAKNVLRIAFNPSNPKQIIIGTQGSGFYFTENKGEAWQNVAFSTGNGNAIAIDPKDENVLYLALDAKIYKSEDGGEKFREIYSEQTGAVQDIIIDPNDSKHLLAIAASGNFLVTRDGGETWKATSFIVGIPNRLVVDPTNINRIYVATAQAGVYVSIDGGESFDNNAFNVLRESIANLEVNIMAANDVTIDPFDPKILMVATDYGLIESVDGGKTYKVVPTLVVPQTTPLRSVSFHPTIKNAVFMSSQNKFYTSTDLGVTWAVVDLPTSREVHDVAVSPADSNEMYLAIKGDKRVRPSDYLGFGLSKDK